MLQSLSTFWKIFRLVFVLFSLYLLGYSFYRWDGFKYYGSLYDFLVSVSLASVLWTIIAVLLSFLVWIICKIVEWVMLRKGRETRIEHLLLNSLMSMGVFMFALIYFWKVKFLISQYAHVTHQIGFIIFIAIFITSTLISVFLAKLFRNRAVSWINTVQERITPLVWLFGIFVIISVPLIAYHTWEKNKEISKATNQISIANKNNRSNILLVTFDALTTRDMSLYGYHRETTPFITEWAKSASTFTMTEAESNYTASTTASLMTGKRVWTHQLYQSHGYIKTNPENLPLLLKNYDYYNVALVQNSLASVEALGISQGFDIAPLSTTFSQRRTIDGIIEKELFEVFGKKFPIYNMLYQQHFILGQLLKSIPQDAFISNTEFPPEKVFNKLIEIIDNYPPEPFFIWVHLFPPHDPFLPPAPFIGMFDSSPAYRTIRSQRRLWLARHEPVRARYDEFIRYCDQEFEKFINKFNEKNISRNTIIILSSDHGESFEHDYITHGGIHLYEAVTNIPLIIKEPEQTEGRIITDVVEQIDIAPTILEFANIPAPSWMEGKSIVPLLRGKELPLKPALSMTLWQNPSGHKITDGTFAVWDGDYKMIHYLKDNKSLLFNLKQDPGELNNLVDRKPEIAQDLLFYIMSNLKKTNEKIGKEN